MMYLDAIPPKIVKYIGKRIAATSASISPLLQGSQAKLGTPLSLSGRRAGLALNRGQYVVSDVITRIQIRN